MKDGLLEKIKSRGYWRINFRPLSEPDRVLSINQCKSVVERNRVSLRGWDYPHIPRIEETALLESSFEAWNDWSTHIEFWRMYTSTQFIHYRAVPEDWRAEDPFSQSGSSQDERILGVTMHSWHLTEVFEFLSRLTKDGLYGGGVQVSLSLMNTANRTLTVDDHKRAPFSYDRATGAKELTYTTDLQPADLTEPKQRAADAILYFWDKFGFEPAREQVLQVIEELYHVL